MSPFWKWFSQVTLFTAAIIGLAYCAAHAEGWSPAAMNRQIDQTNFLVNRGCSGTLIDNNRNLILTAAHCILDQYETVEKDKVDADGRVIKEKIRIVRPGTVSQEYFAGPAIVQTNSYVYKIVDTDRALDLALLKVQTKLPATQAAIIACNDPIRGDTVYAVGNSYAVLYSTVTKGIVSSIERSYRDLNLSGQLGDLTDNGEHGLVQHSAPIAPGNSGGSLYNESGEFIGVNVRGTAAGGFSFSVPLSDVKAFLKNNKADDLFARCGK
jgi:hypothetical protein